MKTEKLCECGCGQPAPIDRNNEKRTGAVRGRPQRFVRGHSTRIRHTSNLKRCYRCRQDFPRTLLFFDREERNLDGLSSRCKGCLVAMETVFLQREERKRSYQEAYRETHRAKKLAYAKKWRAENSERFLEQIRQWRLENFERSRELARKNRAKYKVALWHAKQRRRAKERNAEVGDIDLEKVYASTGGICGICDRPVSRERCHFDHIVPLGKGPHTEENLQPSHKHCNSVKGDRSLEWARERIKQLRLRGDFNDPAADTNHRPTKRNIGNRLEVGV